MGGPRCNGGVPSPEGAGGTSPGPWTQRPGHTWTPKSHLPSPTNPGDDIEGSAQNAHSPDSQKVVKSPKNIIIIIKICL
jgi:hypothetical protein